MSRRLTPLNLMHIRNMEMVTLAGGVIMPPGADDSDDEVPDSDA